RHSLLGAAESDERLGLQEVHLGDEEGVLRAHLPAVAGAMAMGVVVRPAVGAASNLEDRVQVVAEVLARRRRPAGTLDAAIGGLDLERLPVRRRRARPVDEVVTGVGGA